MHSNININTILNEVSTLKHQIEAAQVRLAALEAMLQQAQAAQQPAQVQGEQPAPLPVQQPEQPAQVQGEQVAQQPAPQQESQPEPAPQPEPKEEFEYEGDPDVALKIMELIAGRGRLRISSLRWYLSLEHDVRVSESDIILEVRYLERLEALEGTWTAPGIISRSAPILDPWADRGPGFYEVRRRLRELLNERR